MCRTLRSHCRRIREGVGEAANPGLCCAAYCTRATSDRLPGHTVEPCAVRKGARARFEIPGVPEEIPPDILIAVCSEIIALVGNVPRLGALDAHDGVDLPAFQQLAKALLAGKLVTSCESEAISHVEVAAGVFRPRIGAVLWQRPEAILGTVVQAMAVCVTGGEAQPVTNPLSQCRLQAVVVGKSIVCIPIDVIQVWEGRSVRLHAIGGYQVGRGRDLIQVDKRCQPCAVVGYIANLLAQVVW